MGCFLKGFSLALRRCCRRAGLFMLFHYNWMHSWPFYGLHSTSNCLEKRIKIEVKINQSLKNHSSPFFTTQGSSWIINGTFRQLWWNRQENYCGRSLRGWWGRPWASKVIHHHLFPGYASDDAHTMISTGWEFGGTHISYFFRVHISYNFSFLQGSTFPTIFKREHRNALLYISIFFWHEPFDYK